MTTSTKSFAVGVLICVAMMSATTVAHTATITAANHSLLPNTAGQQVQMFVAGGGLVSGLDFFVQVGYGGAAVGGTNTGPTITNLDLTTGTIFAGNNTGILTEHTPLIWTGTTTTMKGSVAANGLVAILTVDTTGLAHGEFPLILNPPSTGPTQLFGGGVTTSLSSGSLHVVPVQGDFSLDGKLTNGDMQRMLDALHSLLSYQTNNGLSDSDLRAIGDINGDQAVTVADLQPLLRLLTGSSAAAVPEPATVVLMAISLPVLAFAAARRRGS